MDKTGNWRIYKKKKQKESKRKIKKIETEANKPKNSQRKGSRIEKGNKK